MSLLFDEICEQPGVLRDLSAKNGAVVSSVAEEYKKRELHGIYFAARGTSDHACVYAQYLFGIVAGIPCALGTPSVITKYGAKINFGSQLVVGVSVRQSRGRARGAPSGERRRLPHGRRHERSRIARGERGEISSLLLGGRGNQHSGYKDLYGSDVSARPALRKDLR